MAAEEPEFAVVLQEEPFEVRDYPELIAAEVTVSGDRNEASNAGFRLLAGYIFGGNTRQQDIAMTAPVVQERSPSENIAMTAPVIQSGDEEEWVVRFIMPSEYTMETLPTPNNDQVTLVPIAAHQVAVVRFSGLARPDEVERRTESLEAFMSDQGLVAAGPASLARYDPPWTLWFARRNEVWIPVATSE